MKKKKKTTTEHKYKGPSLIENLAGMSSWDEPKPKRKVRKRVTEYF